MRAAARLSRRHFGLTAENPSVGALIVRNGRIIGRGVTAPGGRPHAEVIALAEAGEAARGATAYVTLEPCAHWGRTPPCAEALVEVGVARVVIACPDPDSRVDGRGMSILRKMGISVEQDVAGKTALITLAPFLTRVRYERPYVLLKIAVSRDGFIGRFGEAQTRITGPIAQRQAHQMRARADTILVGSGTARLDDPELTCRLPGLQDRSPMRIVLGTKGALDPAGKLAQTAKRIPTFVASLSEPSEELQQLGVRGIEVQTGEEGVDLVALMTTLVRDYAVSSLMVEGGAAVARSFLDAGLVDEIALFVGDVVLGEGVASPIAPTHVPKGFEIVRRDRFGPDTLITMRRRS